jgi:hypothetical protein
MYRASPTGSIRSATTGATTTLCWAAKGGSGTTVVTASLGLTAPRPVLLVDLAGDLPAALGIAEPHGPGVHDWLAAEADASRLADLAVAVTEGVELVPAGSCRTGPDSPRWRDLAEALQRWATPGGGLGGHLGTVLVDGGTGAPPEGLRRRLDRDLLVTRGCYLALRRAVTLDRRPAGVIVVEEPGRSLRPVDIETAIGSPVVAAVALDISVFRAVDAGLLAARVPRVIERDLRGAA